MIQDDYRDEEHDADEETVERAHTKEHYTWLVETLLNGLKEHASFVEKYPDIAAPVEMKTIRDEMERALLKGMRLLYCSEQVELLNTMVEESEPAMTPYLTGLLNLAQLEMAASTLSAELQKEEKAHDSDDWQALINASGWRTPEGESRHPQNDWIERRVPSEVPAFLENIITIFPTYGKLEKATRRVQQQLQNASLGWSVLRRSLDLGSSVFELESSVDRKIKSDMRAGHLESQASTEM
jgi:hypothetical protein